MRDKFIYWWHEILNIDILWTQSFYVYGQFSQEFKKDCKILILNPAYFFPFLDFLFTNLNSPSMIAAAAICATFQNLRYQFGSFCPSNYELIQRLTEVTGVDEVCTIEAKTIKFYEVFV